MLTKLNSIIRGIEADSCDHECKPLLFGAFTLELMSAKLTFPCPSTPFSGLSVEGIRNWIQDFRLPNIYRPSDLPRKHPVLTEDTWLYRDAKKGPLRFSLGGSFADTYAQVVDHSCPLRTMVTTSISGALATASGLNLPYFRECI